MSAVMERRTTIIEPQHSFFVGSSQGEEPSTLALTSIAYGVNRSLPPTHAQSRSAAMYQLTERLSMFRSLEVDWDGYGGESASFGSFINSIEFVNQLPRRFSLPASMLAGDGEISLFWKQGSHYLEASFPGDNTYHFIYKNGAETYASPDVGLDALNLDAKFVGFLARI